MENFYNKIKNKLNDPPKTPTDWNLWNKISEEVPYSRRAIPLWWLVPAVAVFSGVVGYFLHFHDDSNVLEETIVYVRDTVYIDNFIAQTDTVFIQKYSRPIEYADIDLNKIQDYIQLDQKSRLFEKEVEELQSELNAIGKIIVQSNLGNDARLIPFVKRYLEKNPDSELALLDKRLFFEQPNEIGSDSHLSVHYKPSPIVRNVFWDKLIRSKKSKSFLDNLLPDYFNVGPFIEAPSLAVHDNFGPGLDLSGGIQLEAIFSPKTSIIIGAGTRMSMGSTENLEIASLFPQPQNVDEDARFANLKIISKNIDLPLYLKYKIKQKKNWDFFLSGGLVFSKASEIEYKYEYKVIDTEIYYEVKDEQGDWNLGSFTFGVGVESDIFSRWTLSVAPQLRYNFNADIPNNYKNHALGLRIAMMYNL